MKDTNMKKGWLVLAVIGMLLGVTGVQAEVLSLEGKATITPASGKEPALLVVEGTDFQMTGEALSAFAKEHGAGDYIVLVEGDFDLEGQKVAVKTITLQEKLRF